MSRVAVVGNTPRAIGAVCAADLTLSGHEVRFTVFPGQSAVLPELRKTGGFTVEGDPKHLVSKKTGFAKLDRICDTICSAGPCALHGSTPVNSSYATTPHAN